MRGRRLVILVLMALLHCQPSKSRELRIGALIPWNGTWRVGPRMASGLLVAFDTIKNKLNLLPSYNLSYVWKDSQCDAGASLRAIADLRLVKPAIDAFIGPGCSVGCVPGGYLAAHWNIPMISFGCVELTLSNKQQYQTFVRTVGNYAQMGRFYVSIMKKYNWKRVAVLTSSESLWTQVGSLVRAKIEAAGDEGYRGTVSYFQVFSPGITTDEQFKSMLRSAGDIAYGKCRINFTSKFRSARDDVACGKRRIIMAWQKEDHAK